MFGVSPECSQSKGGSAFLVSGLTRVWVCMQDNRKHSSGYFCGRPRFDRISSSTGYIRKCCFCLGCQSSVTAHKHLPQFFHTFREATLVPIFDLLCPSCVPTMESCFSNRHWIHSGGINNSFAFAHNSLNLWIGSPSGASTPTTH